MPRLTAVRARLLFQALVFICLAVNVELYCYYQLQRQGLETTDGVAVLDPIRRWRLQHPADNADEVNADGIRNPPVASPRPAGELRILCLGGSVAYGLGLTAPETYERQLERQLSGHLAPGATVNVINGGIPGYTSDQFTALLYELGERYQPQIVIVMVGFNEPGVRRWEDSTGPQLDSVRRGLYRSATYRYLHRVLVPDVQPSPPHPPRNWIQNTVDNLALIADYCQAHGSRLLLVFEARRCWASLQPLEAVPGAPPTKGTYPNLTYGRDPRTTTRLKTAIEDMAAGRDIPFLDMDALFSAFVKQGHMEDDVFLERDAVHPNPFGASLVADALTRELLKAGWVPPEATATVSP